MLEGVGASQQVVACKIGERLEPRRFDVIEELAFAQQQQKCYDFSLYGFIVIFGFHMRCFYVVI